MEPKTQCYKLETIFFSTLDALRGVWNSEHASNSLLTIIFHKRICSLGQEGLINFLDFDEADQRCWDFFAAEIVKNPTAAVSRLRNTLAAFSNRNTRLKNIFLPLNEALKKEQNPQLLLQFLILLDDIEFSSQVISIADFGLFFNECLYRTALSGGLNGKKRTSPPTINQLMVALCSPKGGEIIYDPTAGQGSSLISFVHHLPNVDIIAREENPQHVALCCMNLIVNGVYHADVRCTNVLIGTSADTIKVDYAVAHFPFGQYINSDIIKDQQYLSIPFDINTPRLHCNALFIQKMLSKLNKEGKMLALMPIHFLSNGGEDKKLREFLIRRDLIESVVALPFGLLYSTGIPVCILVINKNKAIDRKEQVVFINGANLKVKAKTKLYRELTERQINQIAEAFHFLNTENAPGLKDCVVRIPIHQIILNDYHLDAKRYASPFISELRKLESKGSLIKLKEVFKKEQPSLWFDNAFQDIPYIRPQHLGDSLSNYLVDIRNCPNTSTVKQVAGQLIRENCLLIKRSGKKFKASYFIFEQKPVLVNEDIMTFRVNEDKVLSEYLLMMLYDDLFLQQLNMYKSDYQSKAILEEQFEALQINLPDLETQQAILVDCKKQLLKEEENKVEKLRADLNLGKQKAQNEQYKIISSLQHELGNKLPAALMEFKNLKDYLKDKDADKTIINLNDPIFPSLEGEKTDSVDKIATVVERIEYILSHSINSLDATSDIIKADRSHLKLEICNLKFFIEELQQLYAQEFFNMLIEIEEDEKGEELAIYAPIDRTQMTTVFSNFIENAIRHGFVDDQKKYTILFRIAYSNEKQEVVIQYKNDGRSFPPNFSFDDFIGYGNYAGNTGHSGIGGFLIHQIIDNHNGQISYQEIIDSRDPYKVQFEITLPI